MPERWSLKLLRHRAVTTKIFLALFSSSMLLNVFVGLLFRFRSSPLQLEADEREYYEIAQSIYAGTFELSPRRSLGFPVIEACVLAFTDNFVVLQLVVTAMYSLAPPLLFLLVRKLTKDVRSALVSALALTMWPPALYFGVSLYSEAVALPLLLLTLVVLPVGRRLAPAETTDTIVAFVAGVCLALTTHVRPMYLLFLPVILLVILLEEGRITTAIKRFALVAAGFVFIIAPWSICMSLKYHHMIVVTSRTAAKRSLAA